MPVLAPHRVVEQFADRLRALPWVTGLMVGGSLATGDHRPGSSDIDLVALVEDPIDQPRIARLLAVHRSVPRRALLGCTYVDLAALSDLAYRHPTFTHGLLVDRALSGVVRAELVRHGYAVFGPAPADVFAPVSDDDVRAAVRAELDGYWRWALRRPWLWLGRSHQDLALTTMARARHALDTGELITKSLAIQRLPAMGVDPRVAARVRRRRDGGRTGLAGRRTPYRLTAARVGHRLTRRLVTEA